MLYTSKIPPTPLNKGDQKGIEYKSEIIKIEEYYKEA
jgi:hypothetical protein